MNKSLNDALTDVKYPEFTNRLFDSLLIPFGIIQNKNYNKESYESTKETCYECLEEDVYDCLFNLAKYKMPKVVTKKKAILNKKENKSKTQKNAKKREKIINQIHSTF